MKGSVSSIYSIYSIYFIKIKHNQYSKPTSSNFTEFCKVLLLRYQKKNIKKQTEKHNEIENNNADHDNSKKAIGFFRGLRRAQNPIRHVR